MSYFFLLGFFFRGNGMAVPAPTYKNCTFTANLCERRLNVWSITDYNRGIYNLSRKGSRIWRRAKRTINFGSLKTPESVWWGLRSEMTIYGVPRGASSSRLRGLDWPLTIRVFRKTTTLYFWTPLERWTEIYLICKRCNIQSFRSGSTIDNKKMLRSVKEV